MANLRRKQVNSPPCFPAHSGYPILRTIREEHVALYELTPRCRELETILRLLGRLRPGSGLLGDLRQQSLPHGAELGRDLLADAAADDVDGEMFHRSRLPHHGNRRGTRPPIAARIHPLQQFGARSAKAPWKTAAMPAGNHVNGELLGRSLDRNSIGVIVRGMGYGMLICHAALSGAGCSVSLRSGP